MDLGSIIVMFVFVIFLLIFIPAMIIQNRKTNQHLKEIFQEIAQGKNGVVKESMLGLYPRLSIPFGNYNLEVFITMGGKNSPPYTFVRCRFPDRKKVSLTVFKEGLIAKFGKSLGMQDIVVGEPSFDDIFIVRSKDEMLAKQILSSIIREGLLGIASLDPYLNISKRSMTLRVPLKLSTRQDFNNLVKVGLSIVQKVSQMG